MTHSIREQQLLKVSTLLNSEMANAVISQLSKEDILKWGFLIARHIERNPLDSLDALLSLKTLHEVHPFSKREEMEAFVRLVQDLDAPIHEESKSQENPTQNITTNRDDSRCTSGSVEKSIPHNDSKRLGLSSDNSNSQHKRATSCIESLLHASLISAENDQINLKGLDTPIETPQNLIEEKTQSFVKKPTKAEITSTTNTKRAFSSSKTVRPQWNSTVKPHIQTTTYFKLNSRRPSTAQRKDVSKNANPLQNKAVSSQTRPQPPK